MHEAIRLPVGMLARISNIYEATAARLFPLPPRSADPYATHLPILIGIGRLFPIRTVLELGCGRFSTLSFLDPAIFPFLSRIDSVENDQQWREHISTLTSDPRLTLTFADLPISEVVHGLPLEGYDLIFVDDSTNAASRSATIRQVAARSHPHSLIVIHDFELLPYRQAASPLPHRYIFTAFVPQTGLAWKEARVPRWRLLRLSAVIKRYARSIAPADRRQWTELMRRHFRQVQG